MICNGEGRILDGDVEETHKGEFGDLHVLKFEGGFF